MSSKEGDGSTFGFFFKVRRSDGSNENGRPPFSSRSNSENPSNPNQRAQTPRPGYSRSNSQLTDIKERTNGQDRKDLRKDAKENEKDGVNNDRRPKPSQLTSHTGVDIDNVDPSLKDPPTGYFSESHPESTEDSRYYETESVANQITPPVEGDQNERIPYSESGETERQEATAVKTHKAQETQRSEDKRTLLLVEDNLINQKVLRRQLQARGFEVFVANNGQEAIDAVDKRGRTVVEDQHNRNYFDCILMDQEMPIKDGNQATVEIRRLQDEGKAGYSKILGVSANVREAQRNSMREAGMDDLISKPFKVDDLVEKINALTFGGNDGKGEDGKLAKEAENRGEDTDLMEGEKESREKEDRKSNQEEKPEDKLQEKLEDEQQEKLEDKQRRKPRNKQQGTPRGKQQGKPRDKQPDKPKDKQLEKASDKRTVVRKERKEDDEKEQKSTQGEQNHDAPRLNGKESEGM